MAIPAFRFRKATIDDFSDFYPFHLEDANFWLMFDEYNRDEPEVNEPIAESYFFTEEDVKRIAEYYVNFNENDFQDYLKYYRTFMIYIENKLVGYVALENYCGKMIIREWPLLQEYHNNIPLLEAMLEKIETYRAKKCKGLQAIACSDRAKEFLENHGYSCRCIPFYDKSVV